MTPGFLIFMCLKVATAIAVLCVVVPSAVCQDEPPTVLVGLFAVVVLVAAACQDGEAALLAAGVTP